MYLQSKLALEAVLIRHQLQLNPVQAMKLCGDKFLSQFSNQVKLTHNTAKKIDQKEDLSHRLSTNNYYAVLSVPFCNCENKLAI